MLIRNFGKKFIFINLNFGVGDSVGARAKAG